MAWSWSLSIEVGGRQDAAVAIRDALLDCMTQSQGTVYQDPDGNWWCSIWIQGPDEIPHAYDCLRGCGVGFRYALAGLEVDEFRTSSELFTENPSDFLKNFPGLVIADPLYEFLGRRNNAAIAMERFAPGYWWVPYDDGRDEP